jgi:hypothetical protein
MLPGQPAEEDCHFVTLFRTERPFDGTVEVTDRSTVQAHHAGQTRTLLGQLALDFFLALRMLQFV